MNILTIPARCARRKPLRSLVLLAVFTLGVTAIVALQNVSQVVGESLERKLMAYGANIMLTPRSESLQVSYGGLQLGNLLMDRTPLDLDEVMRGVQGIELNERISAVAPKLVAMAKARGTAVGVIGVDWQQELLLKNHWALEGEYPHMAAGGASAAPGLVAGSEVAAKLSLAPGDSVELKGRPFMVTGVLQPTGSDDDTVFFAEIASLQTLLGRQGQADFVEVAALCAGCPIEDIVNQLQQALPAAEVKALRSVVQQRMYSIQFVQRLVMTVSLVILLTGCCMVGLSMLSAVNERSREIGLLRSLGYSQGRVFTIFCVEALLLGLLAGALGYGLGFGASFKVVSVLGVADTAELAFAPLQLLATCGGIALVSVLAAVLPAWKAARVEPWQVLSGI